MPKERFKNFVYFQKLRCRCGSSLGKILIMIVSRRSVLIHVIKLIIFILVIDTKIASFSKVLLYREESWHCLPVAGGQTVWIGFVVYTSSGTIKPSKHFLTIQFRSFLLMSKTIFFFPSNLTPTEKKSKLSRLLVFPMLASHQPFWQPLNYI